MVSHDLNILRVLENLLKHTHTHVLHEERVRNTFLRRYRFSQEEMRPSTKNWRRNQDSKTDAKHLTPSFISPFKQEWSHVWIRPEKVGQSDKNDPEERAETFT